MVDGLQTVANAPPMPLPADAPGPGDPRFGGEDGERPPLRLPERGTEGGGDGRRLRAREALRGPGT
jgi:hypothetical protein